MGGEIGEQTREAHEILRLAAEDARVAAQQARRALGELSGPRLEPLRPRSEVPTLIAKVGLE